MAEINIKELKLKEFHDSVTQCFIDNNISYEADYTFEENPKLNSSIIYTIEINNVARSGFIVSNKGKFGGVIHKVELAKYLGKEGFDEDQIFEEPIFSIAPCVASFVCMLAIPIISDLHFPDDLLEEFQKQVKKAKAKKKKVKKKD